MIDESRSRYLQPKRPRWGLLALIAGLHVLAIIGLARALAPDFTSSVIERASALVTIDIAPPPPPLPPPPPPEPVPEPSSAPDEGAAGNPGREGIPRETVIPAPAIVLPTPTPTPTPRAPSTGTAVSSGTRDAGLGTGAGGAGDGPGAGRGGSGRGGMPVTGPVKIAGDINNAADYPTPPGGRNVRLGHSVTVAVTVTTEGRARGCRIVSPSPDPVADRITCDLVEQRFRFRPALNAAGQAVEATYGWRQSWFRR